MPIVNVVPVTETVEDVLAGRMGEIRALVKAAVCKASGFPEDDVLVNLMQCPYRSVDPASASFVVYADTCPHEDLELKADDLCRTVARVLAGMFQQGSFEVWPRFLPGPWCLVRDGEIVDFVSHQR